MRRSRASKILVVFLALVTFSPYVLAWHGDENPPPEERPGPTPEEIPGEPVPADGDVGAFSHSTTVTKHVVTETYPAAVSGCPDPAAAPNRDFDIRDGYVNSWITYHIATTSPVRFDWFYVYDGENNQNAVWIWKTFTHNSGTGGFCWESGQHVDGSAHQAKPGKWHFELYIGGNGNARSGTQVCVSMDSGCVWRYTVWPKIKAGGTYGSTPGDGQTAFPDTGGPVRVYTDWDSTGAAVAHSIQYRWYRPDGTEHARSSATNLAKGQSQARTTASINIVATGMDAYPGSWEVRGWADETNYFHDARFVFQVTIDCSPDQDLDKVNRCQEASQGTSPTDPDSDDDGIDDLKESRWWGSRNATYCRGAQAYCEYPDPLVRDLYVEVDYYQGHSLTQAALDEIRSAFASSPLTPDIRLHVDNGDLGGSGSLGTGGDVTFNGARQKQASNVAASRQGVFHYAVMACRDSAHPGYAGQAEPFGDFFVIWSCQIEPSYYNFDQAVFFLHELGHNLLGYRYDPSGGSRSDAIPACAYFKERSNLALSHFEWPDPIDCDGDRFIDATGHSSDAMDAMYQGDPRDVTVIGYVDATWQALSLNRAVGPGAPAEPPRCTAELPSLPIDPDLLLGQCSLPHGDAPRARSGAERPLPGPALGGVGAVVTILGLLAACRRRL